MEMIKGYIFDYGGTLDTCGCHWGKKIWHAYERCGVPVSETDFRDAYVFAERKLGKERIILPDFTFHRTLDVKLEIEMQWLVDNGRWDASAEEVEAKHDAVLELLYDEVVKTQEHSREVLEKIAAQGCPMVLVSNFYGNVGVVLREFHLDHLFLDIVESAVMGIRKPDPQIFALGVEAICHSLSSYQREGVHSILSPEGGVGGGHAHDIMVVGDSIDKDIIPAKSLGCQTAWFKGEGWTDVPVDETIPDVIITDLSDLLELT